MELLNFVMHHRRVLHVCCMLVMQACCAAVDLQGQLGPSRGTLCTSFLGLAVLLWWCSCLIKLCFHLVVSVC
jgi:hypothetical protein